MENPILMGSAAYVAVAAASAAKPAAAAMSRLNIVFPLVGFSAISETPPFPDR